MGEVYLTVLGLFGLLTIAVLMLPAARRLNFPYTVLVAFVGILLGIVVQFSGLGGHGRPDSFFNIPILNELIEAIGTFEVTSEVILFVFLPALIFESSLSIDVRRLIEDVGPILMLAVFGLIASTVMIGGVMWLVSPMTLIVCLLLGAILSATDPVAVVAIFKDMGAPRRLGILVEGESLFNDATAIVLFNILLAMVLGTATPSVFSGVLSFLQVFMGGVIVGYILARLTCWLIGTLRNQAIVEITLTIALAYFAFVFAEHFLHVSGVTATMTAALVLATTGRTRISGESWEMLHETWSNIGFWANSLIFILVGLAVPSILADVTTFDLIMLAALLVTAMTARAALVYGMLPPLAKLAVEGGVSQGYKAVMAWGGLRGAVSLALAMALVENPLVPPDVQRFIIILVTGFVLFTLFVNATTIRLVMRAYGLNEPTRSDLVVTNRAMISAISDVKEQINDFAGRHNIGEDITTPLNREYDARIHFLSQDMEAVGDLDHDEWLQVVLSALTNREKEFYLELYREGFLSSHVAEVLIGHSDDLRDGVRHSGIEGYRRAMPRIADFPKSFLLALLIHRRFRIAYWLSNALANRFETLRSCLSAVADLEDEGVKRMRALVGNSVLEDVKTLLAERRVILEQAVTALRTQYSEYALQMEERAMGQVAVRVEGQDYWQMYDDGVLSTDVHNALEKQLEVTSEKYARRPPLDLGLRPEQLISKVSLFEDLSATDRATIASILKPRLAIPNEYVVRKGEIGDSMYLISSGSLNVLVGDQVFTLGNGDFFGEMALVLDQPRNADVVSNSFCDLLCLRKKDFTRLLQENAAIREHVESIAAERQKADEDKESEKAKAEQQPPDTTAQES